MSKAVSGAAQAAPVPLKLSGVEAIGDVFRDGYDGLQIRCRGCRAISCFPFKLLLLRHRVRIGHTVREVASRFVCRRCRTRVSCTEDVTPWRIHDGQPRMSYAGPQKGES